MSPVRAADPYGCSVACVVTSGTYTKAARQLALANDVHLIDWDELAWFAKNPDPEPKDRLVRRHQYVSPEMLEILGIDLNDSTDEAPDAELEEARAAAGECGLAEVFELSSRRDVTRSRAVTTE
jgi:hypothetical protein